MTLSDSKQDVNRRRALVNLSGWVSDWCPEDYIMNSLFLTNSVLLLKNKSHRSWDFHCNKNKDFCRYNNVLIHYQNLNHVFYGISSYCFLASFQYWWGSVFSAKWQTKATMEDLCD